MLDRRSLMTTSVAAAAGATVWSTGLSASADPSSDSQLSRLLQRSAESLLARSPEEATSLGHDVGALAALRSELDDRSLPAMQMAKADADRMLGVLRRILPQTLTPEDVRYRDLAIFVFETFADLLGRYGYIDLNLRPSPYVVSQMNGAYFWLPDFIGSRHPLESSADVEAFYARLNALAVALDQETARIRHDAGIGVTPPRFVIDRTISQLMQLRDGPPKASALIAPAVARAAKRGLGDIGVRAEAIFRSAIVPALSRQIDALAALRPGAVETAGVWRLPDGDGYYAAALRANTTIDVDPAALHAAGLEQVRSLLDEIDRGLKAQGLTQGSVGRRIDALNRDPRFLVSDDDEGRAQLMALAQRELDEVTRRLPRAFNDPHVDPIVVRRVAPAIEAGAPAAFYEEGSAGQPGAFMLNLARPTDYPIWRLPTLTHHEGVPGHHFQFDVVRRQGRLPLFSRLVQFSAYTEGWALYAQQVADEIGVYDNDPFGRIGYLQSELFRAARIVVDTGLHHKRWTRQQAVTWMVEEIGETPEATAREIDRYCVYPGQACSFKVGANTIVQARETARRRLGSRFDVRKFHDLVLKSGPMPMAVLQSSAAQWTG